MRPSSPAAWAPRASAASEALKIDAEKKEAAVAGTDVVIREGDMISIDGTHGHRGAGRRGAGAARADGRSRTRSSNGPTSSARMGVRANADNPEDARAVPRLRRRGHRSLPYRAHVPGRPQADHPVLHPQRRRRPSREKAARATCSRRRRATSTACSRPWTACRSSCACSTRRCTSSSRAPASWRWRSRALEATGGAGRRASPRSASSWSQIDAMSRGEPDARPARLPPGHRVSRACPPCRCAPSPPPRPSLRRRASIPSPRS